ncbi:hypothetical protein B0H14DRAFT_3477928 [Mycena olivaceomarginata]|nr:hypothetical protein B0H14DRAFT_3477928 [Mycena olivaceomarginata]
MEDDLANVNTSDETDPGQEFQYDYAGKISFAVTTLSDVIYSVLNESITNQSAGYATTLDSRMDEIQTTINNSGVFGWV